MIYKISYERKALSSLLQEKSIMVYNNTKIAVKNSSFCM